MTKKELEMEAEEYAKKNGSCFSKEYGIRYRTYMDCAEPREKRIAELESENEQIKNSDTLCKLIGEQERKITELEQQIKKMKCCENCGWFYLQQHWRESKEINESRMFHCGTCGNKKNWKLKEIKEK